MDESYYVELFVGKTRLISYWNLTKETADTVVAYFHKAGMTSAKAKNKDEDGHRLSPQGHREGDTGEAEISFGKGKPMR